MLYSDDTNANNANSTPYDSYEIVTKEMKKKAMYYQLNANIALYLIITVIFSGIALFFFADKIISHSNSLDDAVATIKKLDTIIKKYSVDTTITLVQTTIKLAPTTSNPDSPILASIEKQMQVLAGIANDIKENQDRRNNQPIEVTIKNLNPDTPPPSFAKLQIEIDKVNNFLRTASELLKPNAISNGNVDKVAGILETMSNLLNPSTISKLGVDKVNRVLDILHDLMKLDTGSKTGANKAKDALERLSNVIKIEGGSKVDSEKVNAILKAIADSLNSSETSAKGDQENGVSWKAFSKDTIVIKQVLNMQGDITIKSPSIDSLFKDSKLLKLKLKRRK